jgi:Putative adhesin
MRPHPLLLVLLCTAAACGRRAHESRDAFRWEQEVPPGTTIHLRTITGGIEVVPATGQSARIAGTTRWVGRKDPIRFAWTRDGNDVYVCALWSANADCQSGNDSFRGSDHSWLDMFSLFKRRSTNAVASLRVALPPGVKVDAHTVSGSISMHGATSGITAQTLNGSIDIDKSAGPVEAKGTNGSIEVALDSLAPDDRVVLESVNGSMTAILPPSLEADVQLSTVNGRVKSDFPISTDDISNHRLHGQIGKSSREVLLRTVNGNVSLLKQQGESQPEPSRATRDRRARS